MKKIFYAAPLLFSILFFHQNAFAADKENSALVDAIYKNNLAKISELIAQGADVNTAGEETPLLTAIDGQYNIEVVKLLLGAKGIDVNKFGARALGAYAWIRTPLHVAAQNGLTDVVKLLLEKGARVDPKDSYYPDQTLYGKGPLNTPLMLAAREAHPEIVTLLLDKGANVNYQNHTGQTPLMFSINPNTTNSKTKADALKVVKIFLDRGAKVDTLAIPADAKYLKIDLPPGTPSTVNPVGLLNGDGVSALMIAAEQGLVDAAGLLLDYKAAIELPAYGAKWTALLFAVQMDKPAMVTYLLDRGANIEVADTAGTTPILLAAAGLYFETTSVLLKRGAKVNATTGPNALMLAINHSRPDKESASIKIMKLLIDKGIDVNFQNVQGVSPLMVACGWGVIPKSTQRARLLLEKGAKVELQNKQGETALMFAAYRGYVDIAKLLLEKGANVNAKNSAGRTPLMIASTAVVDLKGINGDFARVVKLLIEKGADVNAMDNEKNSALSLATRYERKETIALLTAKGATLAASAPVSDSWKAVIGTWEGLKNSNPYEVHRFTFNSDKTWTYSAEASTALKKEYPDTVSSFNDQLKIQVSQQGNKGTFAFREQFMVLKTNSIFAPERVFQWKVEKSKLVLNGGEFNLTKVGK